MNDGGNFQNLGGVNSEKIKYLDNKGTLRVGPKQTNIIPTSNQTGPELKQRQTVITFSLEN